MKEEQMKQLLKEMQANCVKGMLKGAIYEDEKAEQKAIAIDLVLNLIETQNVEIEKKDKQIERYINMLATNDMLHVLECEKKDKEIELMAKVIYKLDIVSEYGFNKEEVIEYFTKLAEEEK